jgi:hypothetical protein
VKTVIRRRCLRIGSAVVVFTRGKKFSFFDFSEDLLEMVIPSVSCLHQPGRKKTGGSRPFFDPAHWLLTQRGSQHFDRASIGMQMRV